MYSNPSPENYSMPVLTYPSDVIPHLHFPTFTLKTMKKTEEEHAALGGVKNANIQTDFRDNEVQTSPWQPPYKLLNNDGSVTPQILKLDFLQWGSGLPAGKNEVTLIERARMKRAWEKYLPPPVDEATLEKRRNVIEAMELDEWAFREKEIGEIQNLRLKLLEEMLNELHEKSKNRNREKLKNITEIKRRETDEKIQKLRAKTERELRKLELKHRGVNMKYHPTDLVEEHAHPKSELYAPLMRHGEHPIRWHQVLDEKLKYYKAQFIGIEEFSTLPRWLEKATIIKDDYNTTKQSKTQICMRETKWTTPVLKKLHEELKNLNKISTKKTTLRVKIEKTPSEASTPETDELPDTEEDKYQAIVKIQSVLKGRASQMLIYEGRDKCRELIKELKYSTGLLDEQRESIGIKRKEIKHLQRDESIQTDKLEKLKRALNKLEGSVVGSLLDFLNKELRRLLDERRAHAICFLNERERNDREAAEAGRRQKELRRRREHDEMFKQMVKVRQDTVDLYLQDIITEGMEFASDAEAEFYIKKLSEQIERDNARELENSIEITEQEEMISDLVHHFVLPEVQKEMVRERIRKRQHEKLVRINDTLFDDLLEHVPQPKTTVGAMSEPEDELPPSGFHFEYQTEQELIESLWKDDDEDDRSQISGRVSSEDSNEDAIVNFSKYRSPSTEFMRKKMESFEHVPVESSIEEVKAEDIGTVEILEEVEELPESSIQTEKSDESDHQSTNAEIAELLEEIVLSSIEKTEENQPYEKSEENTLESSETK